MNNPDSGSSFESWTWTGEGFAPCESAPLSDRGFRYGMSLFESIRIAAGEPHFLPEHLQRLRQACCDREFNVPQAALDQVEAQLRAGGNDGLARVYVTAGPGTATDPAEHCRVYLFIEPRPAPGAGPYEIMISEETHHPPLGGLKTANYWSNLDALQKAFAHERHEALLFNERAELVSACMANVFVVRGPRVRTPAVHCGARAGVIRERVLQRLKVEECSLFVDDLVKAEEVFLTSSWIGVKPVVKLNERTLPSSVADSVASVAQP